MRTLPLAVALLISFAPLGLVHAAGESRHGRPFSPENKPKEAAKPPVPVMQVQIVRSAEPGCASNCAEWIAAQGRIDNTTPRQFKKVLARLGARKLPILIDSPGGLVDESMAIARLIREKGLEVAVAQTELEGCGPADKACRTLEAGGIKLGKPKTMLSKCASSCAFILAGGTRRYVGAGAFVGVHQLTSFETRVKVLRTYRMETERQWGVPVAVHKTLVSERRISESTRKTETKDADYARVARFFTEMGVGDGIMNVLRVTPNTTIHWMSRAELKDSAMSTDTIDGEKVVASAASLPTPSQMSAPTTPPTAAEVMPLAKH